MENQEQTKNPVEEMLKFWQNWMTLGTEAMMRTMTLVAPGAAAFPWGTMFQEQVERAVKMAMDATKFAGFPDLTRFSEELSLLRAETETLSQTMSTMQAAFQAQQQGWKALEAVVQQMAAAQEEAKRAMERWTAQWDEQLGTLGRGMEEWRQRWEEMLRQGVAMSEASQKGLEELTRTMWDVARRKKTTGGK